MSARPGPGGGYYVSSIPTAIANRDGTLSRMNDQSASALQFLKGQEVCQIAFGMYDLQFNWGDGGLSCTGRVIYTPSNGAEVVWTEGHPFDAVPVLLATEHS